LLTPGAALAQTPSEQLWVPLFDTTGQNGSIKLIQTNGETTTSVFATGLSKPGGIKRDQAGNIFVLEYATSSILKISADGQTRTTFAATLPDGGLNDLTVSADGQVFLLVHAEDNEGSFAEVWQIGAVNRLVGSTKGFGALNEDGRGFAIGPNGRFYLAMQGGLNGRIFSLTQQGEVNIYYDPANIPNFLDVKFNAAGEMYILGQAPGGRVIWRVTDLSAPPQLLASLANDEALQIAIGSSYIFTGGFSGVKRVSLDNGTVTQLLTTTDPFLVFDVDDGTFEAFAAPNPQLALEGVKTLVTALISANGLKAGEANALTAKIDTAIKKLDAGKEKPARKALDAFLKQLAAYVKARRLTGSQAQPLIDAVNDVIAQL
jgi:hypothetical protein